MGAMVTTVDRAAFVVVPRGGWRFFAAASATAVGGERAKDIKRNGGARTVRGMDAQGRRHS